MLDSTPANFQHRTDRFGNFDSICKRCFLIVASAREEEELAASETAHICSPIRIFAIADGAIPQIFTIVEEVFGTEPERSGSRVRRLDGPRADSRNIGL